MEKTENEKDIALKKKKEKKKFGRPFKLSPELQEKIVSAIRAGNYAEVAAGYAGISKTTFYDWMRRGEARAKEIAEAGEKKIKIPRDKNGDIFLDFLNAVEQASAVSEIADMTIIGIAAQKNWRAAAWRLEKKFPSRYGRQFVELTGADGAPLITSKVVLKIPDNGRDKKEGLERY